MESVEWVVRAQGREDTQRSICSQPFADVAVTAGTPQPLALYLEGTELLLKQHRDLPERMFMSHQSWILPGKLQGL